jgi:hypothetical protein
MTLGGSSTSLCLKDDKKTGGVAKQNYAWISALLQSVIASRVLCGEAIPRHLQTIV